MPLIEVLAVELGGAIAKALFKAWLKDSEVAQDVSSSLIDLIKSRSNDRVAQLRGERQFAVIGEKVGESLAPMMEQEGYRLDEASRTAVALAVTETLNHAPLDAALLARRNLDPTTLATQLVASNPSASELLNDDETALYQRLLTECSVLVWRTNIRV